MVTIFLMMAITIISYMVVEAIKTLAVTPILQKLLLTFGLIKTLESNALMAAMHTVK